MHLAGVAVGEGLATAAALERLVRRVELLHVDAQVRLAAALGRAQLARIHRLLRYYAHKLVLTKDTDKIYVLGM